MGGDVLKEISMIYPNMTPVNALKSGGMNEMQYYSAVKYDYSIGNDNAKKNDARNHLNASAIMGRRRTGIGIGAGVDAVQSTPTVNQSHASKNLSNLIMGSSFKNLCTLFLQKQIDFAKHHRFESTSKLRY